MLLSLQTVVEVAKLLGVGILPVSFGAVDVTLQDLAMLYQSLATGHFWGFHIPKNHWSLIQRIEDTGAELFTKLIINPVTFWTLVSIIFARNYAFSS